jgi:diaminohydroxyphosphoribosylaminopyrimidine deaminase/5-amino-6-(5-phosphoribosylamino)uracil reductase
MAELSAVDVHFMRRAIRLATLSLGRTWPNPGVGCVIARDGRMLGQGRHAVFGQAHAEVNALAHCRAQGEDPAGATVYVTLAPCTRHGRQPPCVDALIAARVARVVAAIEDPNQDLAHGVLEAAGIAYQSGCCAHEAAHLHAGFLSRVTNGRPRLTGKWAMTLDGSIATCTRDSTWISSVAALAFSRRRRRLFDAIMIGAGTAHQDDPSLLSAQVGERTPVRVVVSAGAELPEHSLLIATRPKAEVLVLHGPDAPPGNLTAVRSHGIELRSVADPHNPLLVAQALADYGFNEVLVEGGAQVHGAFLRAGLYDRIEVYLGSSTIGGGLGVCAGPGIELMRDAHHWQLEEAPRLLGDTVCLRFRRPEPLASDDGEPLVVEED